MHGVHAFQEWLILAGFQAEYLREAPREGAIGANLRSGMGDVLRRLFQIIEASPPLRRRGKVPATSKWGQEWLSRNSRRKWHW
jgi:hypothetical protein